MKENDWKWREGVSRFVPPVFCLSRMVMMQASSVWLQGHSVQFDKYLFNSCSGQGNLKMKTPLSTCVRKTQFFLTVCFFPVSLLYYSHKTLLVTKYVEVSPHQALFCDPSWESYNSTQFLTLSRVSEALCQEQRSKTNRRTRNAPSVLIT